MNTDRDIICWNLQLPQKMQVLRLDFVETVYEDGRAKAVRFSRDYILDDYKQPGPLPKRFDKEGRLIHQNPVFLSGKFRSGVVRRIVAAAVAEFYPGREPEAVAEALSAFTVAAGKLSRREGGIGENIAPVRSALRALQRVYDGPQFSAESYAFYNTTTAMLRAFGRGDGTDSEDDGSEE